MEHSKKELIKEIADLFEDYQETYVPGEWESFSKTRKKKYPFAAKWISIAAVFLLMASVLPVVFNRVSDKKKTDAVAVLKSVIKNGAKSPSAGSGTNAASGSDTAIMRAPIELAEINSHLSGGLKPAVVISAPDTTASERTQQKNAQTSYAGIPVKPAVTSESVTAVVKAINKDTAALAKSGQLSTAEFLMAESKSSGKVSKQKESGSKWDFGLEIMPAATSANVNIGAGLTTAYRLSDKFSLSAGISYTQMEAGGVVPQQSGGGGAGISTFSEKKILSVDANLKAIDIPLALVYELNKHYYTSAGVSYFNVISEKRSNTLEQNSSVEVKSFDPETGYPSTFKAVSVEQVDEPVEEKRLKGNSYIGFFNFSIGRQQNLFNKYKIRIEPFVKIPVGKLSSEDLKLTNSGIKFQLSF
jgi:hypothetical protein